MDYGTISINGEKLKNIWEKGEKKEEYLTKNQLDFIIKEIDLQKRIWDI